MVIHALHTEADYHAAVLRVEQLWEALPGSPEEEELEILHDLIEAFSRRHAEAAAFQAEEAREADRREALNGTDPDAFLLAAYPVPRQLRRPA